MEVKKMKRSEIKDYIYSLKNPKHELKYDEEAVIIPILTGTLWKNEEGVMEEFKGILNDTNVNLVRLRANGIDAWKFNSMKKLKEKARHWNSEYIVITDHTIQMLDE